MLVYGAGAAWIRLFLPGAGVNPISVPGPQTSGVGLNSGGSATLLIIKRGAFSWLKPTKEIGFEAVLKNGGSILLNA